MIKKYYMHGWECHKETYFLLLLLERVVGLLLFWFFETGFHVLQVTMVLKK